MTTTWVVVADSARARIFKTDGGRDHPLQELETLAHPEGRMHETQLTSDLPGRTFDSHGQGRHKMEEVTSPKRHEAIGFAKRVAGRLDAGRTAGDFQSLILVAEPRFLGLLRDNLSSDTVRLATRQIDKNLTQMDLKTIQQQVAGLF